MSEAKNYDPRLENLGAYLFKEVRLEINGEVISKHRPCKKCRKIFQIQSSDEYEKLCRQTSGRQGNLKLCWDCDKSIF
jgi:hypothetical protein